jgi:oxygen-independent coproporphyrinogen-3 oxidase
MSILHNYIVRTPEAFNLIDYGCHLDATEQRRRYAIKSILRVEGMSLSAYGERFGTEAFADIPELEELVCEEFLRCAGDVLCPTQKGIDYSDFIGPRLFSPAMWRAMEAFALR